MAHIQTLPPEILGRILALAAAPTDPKVLISDPSSSVPSRTTLLNLCPVSGYFRNLAQPLLFRDFVLQVDARRIDAFGGCKLVEFTATIYRYPHLSNHVRSIIFRPFASNLFDANWPLERHSVANNLLLHQMIDGIGADWNLDNTSQSDYPKIAALLAYGCPHLQQLALPMGGVWREPFLTLLDRDPSFLSGLRAFCVETEEMEYGECYNILPYYKFLSLPNLSYARFTKGFLINSSFPAACPAELPALNELHFRLCKLDRGALDRIMKACKGLKSFTYNKFSLVPFAHGLERHRLRRSKKFHATHAVTLANDLHRETLEHLDLQFPPQDIVNALETGTSFRLYHRAFADFSRLRSITIQQAFLPAEITFPPSLESFHITCCKSSVESYVVGASEGSKRGMLPNMKLFKVSALDVDRLVSDPAIRGIGAVVLFFRQIFEGTHVVFRMDQHPSKSWDTPSNTAFLK
ncbi:hypothetical protein N7532_011409 [Penicillium argentinense]|uniref:F-box domain-containing protein n=1 Tax=Penicillium argentinense TaxID=1131581 RepID=A0A9W9JUZ6_9EURO|nr:uncharacterized protein N7532_011409 [Penicillium argentinense]KAJ5082366.1 hypothetical protein N7532_011409 [Penicillium argentinense]